MRISLAILILLALVGCQPTPSASTMILPTRAVLPDAQLDLTGAERVARAFLEAWRSSDFETMYNLTSFASQEATPLDAFIGLYEQSHAEMTLMELSYRGNTLARSGSIAIFNYDVMFQTDLLGEFSDGGRNLNLVVDPKVSDWRVAWTPADIFAEMGAGGRLRLRRILPSRANIYDRTGRYTLADQNGRMAVVNVIRQDIPDYANCLTALASALEKPVEELQTKLEARPANWLMDMGVIDAQTYTTVHTQLETLCAATFGEKPVRHYDHGTATANIVGYVGYPREADLPTVLASGFDQDSILGQSGVEASWDETLRGKPGGELTIVTPSGTVLREVAAARSSPPQSLWLTIDFDLQQEVARILSDAYASSLWASTSNGAAAVVMNVNTGEILAMVSYPTFDNNAFLPFPPMGRSDANKLVAEVQTDPRRPQLNRPTLGVYQLGSVMKTVSAIAVVDSGVYALDHKYTCTGIWNRDITRYDWLAGGHGTITTSQALTRSCNPFFYEVGYQLDMRDPYLLPTYAREMGLGELTGLRDLPESAGLIPDPEWLRINYGYEWTFSEAVNVAIGQGFMQVTPLQVTRMIAAVANGGTLYRPQLVKQVGILGETPSFVLEPDPQRELKVRQRVLDMEREGLCNVTTSPSGTAEYIFRHSPLQTIGVCGKTGTAQAPGDTPPHAWFVSWAPREYPEIVVVVMVETAGEGSGVAAPLAKQILEYYFFGRGEQR